MKHGIPASYRIAVASRAVAAILGAYGVAALATGCLSLVLVVPDPPQPAGRMRGARLLVS